MGTSRIRRIGSREAEQLLTADSDASAYPELSHLLAAAAAPPQPDELVGLQSALAEFEAAGWEGRSRVAVASRRRVFARPIAVKAAAGVAVVLFGGTALAAETGNLPGGSQQHAHDLFSGLGVPPPGTVSASPSSPVKQATSLPAPIPTPSTGSPSATPGPSSAATLGLCRSWETQQKNPQDKPMKAEALRALAEAAGGEKQIAAFCADLLAVDPGQTATQRPGTVPPTRSHPGKGKGQSKPTPTPHKNG
jgi:hypothetical protein